LQIAFKLTTVEGIDAHRGAGGRRGFKGSKFFHKNEIKHEKADPLDFLTTPSTPLKRIWPKPLVPPPPLLDFQLLQSIFEELLNNN
jgi:hypothetical protein